LVQATQIEKQPETPSGDEIDLGLVIRWIWARRKIYIVVGAICVILAGGYSYIVPKQYTGQVVLLPKIPVHKAGLLGPLAALSGETTVLEGVDEDLYGQILHSDFILDRVLARTWPSRNEGENISLFDVFGLTEASVRKSLEHRTYFLKTRLRVQVIRFERDPLTGIMNIKTTVPENPALAAALANFLADELDEYNGILNSQRTAKHKEFVESRLKEVQAELEGAEAQLTRFLEENKSYQSSPRLMQKHGELDRDVQAFRAIWLQMRSELETAKIDLNKDIDSIIILDRADPPLFRSAPNRRMYVLAGGIIGFLLATAVALLRSRHVFA
jgi:uncharacterized protein involved in exopolysaccharide biosynthesis